MAENKNYVLVRHLARSPSTKVLRATRAGKRGHGFLLDDGTRIRRQGHKRYQTVGMDVLLRNKDKFIDGMENGLIEVLNASEEPMTINDLFSDAPVVKAKPPVKPEEPKEEEPKEEEEEEDSEEELRDMKWKDLVQLAKDKGINTKGVNKDSLIDLILSQEEE